MWWEACRESQPDAGARKGCIFTFQLSTVNLSTYTPAYISPERSECWGRSGKMQARDWPMGSQQLDILEPPFITEHQNKSVQLRHIGDCARLEVRVELKCDWGQSKTPRLVGRATLMFKYLVHAWCITQVAKEAASSLERLGFQKFPNKETQSVLSSTGLQFSRQPRCQEFPHRWAEGGLWKLH